ncbi:MAG: hypothetical protein F6K28_38765 [Microcoleus sp. SIO2G3]|nr:hypothetical protein [Microcoleus sp. SIO2G3]
MRGQQDCHPAPIHLSIQQCPPRIARSAGGAMLSADRPSSVKSTVRKFKRFQNLRLLAGESREYRGLGDRVSTQWENLSASKLTAIHLHCGGAVKLKRLWVVVSQLI